MLYRDGTEEQRRVATIQLVIDDATGANVTVISSGWGDGAYPTFIGYTASGAVIAFVTDCMVVPSKR